ncbi:phosphatidate cytidylyltransferase [Mycoplasma todarodis]|uniref:Phosphatidate cytidylyltransferase n=1 Tax=Mycoplasma todarodis TaxID=1937191 RepID=A0A4R0XSJ8_9MOLU|nr:phosphatidate cytidylyltransferase [Mycoplasma todarodis]TCG11400.1 hypothetical protein C4B25_01745 [Mycoplasma todarodis]
MKNYLKKVNPRYPSAIIAILLIIPVFICIILGGKGGRIFGSIFMIVGAMYGSYEFIKHMKLHTVSKILIPFLTISVFLVEKDFVMIDIVADGFGRGAVFGEGRMYLTHMIGFSTILIPAIVLTLVLFDPVATADGNRLRTYIYTLFITVAVGIFFRVLFSITVIDWKIVMLLVPVAIISDTFAYIGGSLLGKKFPKKLAPKISPKKTWVGFITGYLFAVLYIVLYIHFTGIFKFDNGNYIVDNSLILKGRYVTLFVMLALALPIVSPVGDLVFSSFKREMGIKDYGKIMPGHGGLLDRIDSWIFIVITFSMIFEMLVW